MSDSEDDGQRPCKRPRFDEPSEASGSANAADTEQPSCSGLGAVRQEPEPESESEPELSERLRKVMLCTVCLDLPHPDESYQCSLGHIVCEDCATRLLAEAALNDRVALCPHCRTHICWQELTKNLAVGQTLWELPKTCADCEQQMKYKCLAKHLQLECCKRMVNCRYRCLGCNWQGCQEASVEHEASCPQLRMSSDEILSTLYANDYMELLTNEPLRQCYRHLSAQRISYEDLELHWPEHNGRPNSELSFQSPTAHVFEQNWRLSVKLLGGTITQYHLSYSLKLMSTPHGPMHVKYFATLPATYVRPKHLMDVEPHLNEELFTLAGQSAEYKLLPMACQIATYRLLAMPNIKVRLWMMLI